MCFFGLASFYSSFSSPSDDVSKLSLQGNEKGPDAQAEQFRQMLSQHMVLKLNNLQNEAIVLLICHNVDGHARLSWPARYDGNSRPDGPSRL